MHEIQDCVCDLRSCDCSQMEHDSLGDFSIFGLSISLKEQQVRYRLRRESSFYSVWKTTKKTCDVFQDPRLLFFRLDEKSENVKVIEGKNLFACNLESFSLPLISNIYNTDGSKTRSKYFSVSISGISNKRLPHFPKYNSSILFCKNCSRICWVRKLNLCKLILKGFGVSQSWKLLFSVRNPFDSTFIAISWVKAKPNHVVINPSEFSIIHPHIWTEQLLDHLQNECFEQSSELEADFLTLRQWREPFSLIKVKRKHFEEVSFSVLFHSVRWPQKNNN